MEGKEVVLIGTAIGEKEAQEMRFKFFPELYVPGAVKSKKVTLTAFHGSDEQIIEMEWENFNNFCLDLFNEHKKIMEARNL